MFGATGGYLLGFIMQGILYSLMIPKFGISKIAKFVAILIGNMCIYIFGTIWFVSVYSTPESSVTFFVALSWCVLPYVIPDIVKTVLAFILCERVQKVIKI
ncbi:MAG: hypothetical protein ATN35_04465 [Epulopiscium sp. Nele67-Bin004]|nr:MAG: hypothetical protein ATN35_04465 [Epulopiscium sp. Nele67-Bin004]